VFTQKVHTETAQTDKNEVQVVYFITAFPTWWMGLLRLNMLKLTSIHHAHLKHYFLQMGQQMFLYI